VFNETWDRNQLNPTCSYRISLLSTPQPQVQVNNNDILLMVGFNCNIKYRVSLLEMQDDIMLLSLLLLVGFYKLRYAWLPPLKRQSKFKAILKSHHHIM